MILRIRLILPFFLFLAGCVPLVGPVPPAEIEAVKAIYTAAGVDISGIDAWSFCETKVSPCNDGHVIAIGLGDSQFDKIPPELFTLEYLTYLNLSGSDLHTLPSEIILLTRLHTLRMSNMPLEALPPELFTLEQLTWLDLSGVPLEALPPEIGNLQQLQRLELSDCRLEVLPDTLFDLARLESLNLSANRLATLPPEIGQLTALESLDLSGNHLEELPPELGQLGTLQALNLFSNELAVLPPELGALAQLARLNLAENELTELPPELGRLTQLASLDLYANPLSGPLPDFLLNMPLKHVDHTATDLCIPDDNAAFSAWFDAMDSIYSNHVPCSEVITIPESEHLALAAIFAAADGERKWHPAVSPCNWRGVSCWNGHVRSLSLYGANFDQLPSEIAALSELEYLELQVNRLTGLPPEIVALENLISLKLNDNLFTAVPSEIGQLSALCLLDLSGNPLEGPLPSFFAYLPLQMFYFENTNLCIPDGANQQAWLDGLADHSEAPPCP